MLFNNYTIWSFLKKCHQRGKIYRGTDVVPWSGRSGTAYSQMEIIEGRKLVAHTSLFLRFPLRGREKESLLVWTTTPWTLSSNVAAAVNVDLDYVKLRSKRDGELYYFAEENWPDFGPEAFKRAIDCYTQRERRFGLTGDQVKPKGSS